MCNGCLELVELAQGPIGPTGLTGADGDDGANGSNGTSLLAAKHDLSSNTTSNTSYATLNSTTETISAAQMNTNEDSIEIRAKYYFNSLVGTTGANYQITIGGVSITEIPTYAVEPGLSKTFPYVDVRILITRKSTTEAHIRVDINSNTYGFIGSTYSNEMVNSGPSSHATYEKLSVGGITWASGNNILFRGKVTNGGNEIKLGHYSIISLKKV